MNLKVNILEAIKKVVHKNSNEFIALHEPHFIGNEWIYIKECIDTGWVSSAGKYVDKFENMLAEYTGVKRAIAVVNGTAALHIALKLGGVEQNDEVLMPAMTFVATANAITYCGAIPHFVDSEEKTLGVDPQKLLNYLTDISKLREDGCYNLVTGRRIKAVIPMHTFGHPADLDHLDEVCKKFNLIMIEDAAESLGSFYKNKHTGNFGFLSILSFNGNKIITTGGSGAILTNSEQHANIAKHITTTAKISHPWEYRHDQIGYNYRLPNLNAALGCAQMENLAINLKNKRNLAHEYEHAFNDIDGVRFFKEAPYSKSNYWLNVLILDEKYAVQRDAVIELTNKYGYMTRPSWTLMHKLPMFSNCPKMDLRQSESLEQRIINIPSGPSLFHEGN